MMLHIQGSVQSVPDTDTQKAEPLSSLTNDSAKTELISQQ